jgi:hypothetical protein
MKKKQFTFSDNKTNRKIILLALEVNNFRWLGDFIAIYRKSYMKRQIVREFQTVVGSHNEVVQYFC